MRSTTFSAERFLPAREILAFAGLSLACRLLTWWAVREIPWLDSPVLDGRAYLDWAREIAGGDALGRGRGVFYQAPLYPYFLAAILKLGGGLEAVRAVQVALGTCATMLVVATTRNLFGARAGVLAGLLFALYPPILIADLQIDKTSVSVFLAALLARLAERALAHGGAARWAGCGAALGGLALVRENALVLLPLLAILGWKSTVDPSFRLRTVAFGLAGLFAVLLPVAARNRIVGGEWALTTAQSGANFYIGNRAGASGSYDPLVAGRSDAPLERADAHRLAEAGAGRPLSATEASRFWWRHAVAEIAAAPAKWGALAARKLYWVFHRFEIPDAESVTIYYREAPLLGGLASVWNFGLLSTLAVAGFLVAGERRRAANGLACAALLLGGATALFFVFGRYRAPLVPLLVPLAALFLDRGLPTLRRMSTAWRALSVLALFGLAAFLVRPLAHESGPTMAMAETNLGVAWAQAGRHAEAVEAYRRALALDPGQREANLNLGNLLFVLGEQSEGLARLRQAALDYPTDSEVRRLLEATERAAGTEPP